MSIQSEAALRSSRTRGGRKQQTVSVGQSQTNIQIAGANAPAVGALAPLVMPVPNLESANTLTQAIAAVNGFGTTFKAVGQYVARERATVEAEEFQSGGAMYEAWVATREKASLEKNYDANQRAALGDTNLFISGNINAALSGLPEGRAKTHFSAQIAQSLARGLAPYANEKSTLDTANYVKGFGQQQSSMITNGDDAKTRSASLNLAVAHVMNVGNVGAAKSQDDVAALVIDNMIHQSASGGGSFETDIEPMLLDYPDLLRDSKIKYQALSQQVRNREYQRVENVKQDVKKAGGTLLQRVDALKAGGVPEVTVLEQIIDYTTAESAGNYGRDDLVDVSSYFSRLSEGDPLKVKWGVILDNGFYNEQKGAAENLQTDFVSGKMPIENYMNALIDGVSKYDSTKSPGQQQSGAMDGDTYTKLLSSTREYQIQAQQRVAEDGLMDRSIAPTVANLKDAGINPSNILDPKVHKIAQIHGRYLPETSRALLVEARKGNVDAIKMILVASQSQRVLETDASAGPVDVYMTNWVNARGAKFALDTNGDVTQQAIQAFKDELAYAESTPNVYEVVDAGLMKVAIERVSDKKGEEFDSSKVKLEQKIREIIGESGENIFVGSDYEDGWFSRERNADDRGLTLVNGHLTDEVQAEVVRRLNLSDAPRMDVLGDPFKGLVNDSIKAVAGNYGILRAGGRSVSVVRLNQLALYYGRTLEMVNAEADKALAEKGLKPEDVESMHPYGRDPATGEMTYTIIMKSTDDRFPQRVHFNLVGVEDVIPGVMSKEASRLFTAQKATEQFPETAAITNMLVEHVKDPGNPEHFMHAVELMKNQKEVSAILNSNATEQVKRLKLDSLLKALPTPSLAFVKDQSGGVTDAQISSANARVVEMIKNPATYEAGRGKAKADADYEAGKARAEADYEAGIAKAKADYEAGRAKFKARADPKTGGN